MEVIFIKDLKNQGKKGEVKKVADGYAQNFLIQKGYAIAKNGENIRHLEHEKQKQNKKEAEEIKVANEIKEKLANETFEFKVKVGEHDKVFGSISVKQIKEELTKKGYNIDKNKIDNTKSISSLGFHNVEIKLHPKVTAKIRIQLVK